MKIIIKTHMKLFSQCVLILWGSVISFSSLAKKPNILYIMSDDHAAPAIGVYGGRLSALNPTPNIDQLASESVQFTQAFTTNSICTPSRAAIMTGQYSQANGVLDLNGRLPKEKQYLPQEFSKLGYQTAMIGKWHLKEEPAAFDYYQVLKSQGTYFDPLLLTRGDKKWPNNGEIHKGHSSDVITAQTLKWLKNRNKNKPYFLMMHYKAPHDYFEYAPRYEDYLKDLEIPLPDDLYEQDKDFGSIATRGKNDELRDVIGTSISKRNIRRNYGKDFGYAQNLPDKEYTYKAYQQYLKAYLRCVKGVDDNLAKLFAYLKQTGQYDNTLIVYTSDQGFMLGEHDLIDKRWMYEPSMQMPLIIKPAKGTKFEPGVSDLLVNNTDFAPTLISYAGGKAPEQMQGKSFANILKGEPQESLREVTYYRYWMHRAHHDVPSHFGIRSKKYKLIFFYGIRTDLNNNRYYQPNYKLESGLTPVQEPTPVAWELYDLEKDPKELKNVYGKPGYKDIADKMKAQLKKVRAELNETDEAYPHIQKRIDEHWLD